MGSINKHWFKNLMSYRTPILGITVSVVLSLFSSAKADVSIQEVDVSAIADLQRPGQAWQRISGQGFHIFEGLDVPLINIRGTKKSWFLEDARLREWTPDFPRANLLSETVGLPDGTVIGGPSANHLRFIKPQGGDAFALIPDAVDLYWSDHLEGADIVFAKRSKEGALLVFDGESFVSSPIPEKGQTRQGEFLPWYSTALDGYFTASATDIWFYRTGDPEWHRLNEIETRSWDPDWGLFQRGSQDILSPDGTLLKVISENQLGLTQYRVSDGYPTAMLPSLAGQWNEVGNSGEVVGWLGFRHRHLLYAENHEEVEERTPKFVRVPPNSDVPQTFPDLRPLLLIYDENSISYQYRFAAMPGTDRLYFLHENGFAYYSDGQVSLLPAEWLGIVGNLPHFLATNHALYVAATNGLFLLGRDDTLTEVLAPRTKAGFGSNDKVFDLGCGGLSIGFFGWKTGIYSLNPTGEAALIMQSHSAIEVYGALPDGKSILFSEKEGHLKLLRAEC
ncbi:hypothetical protein [uncultured Tateyamaria sp.]|uniref:hypothetical protein n=1 Tax=uncultured Tateyamaria sp. TaxID=455651 RepID=UPI0026273F59|nr:hypothetical protein [uncultured Tateyamaria sp.]